jgi:tRNA nucleotidyltransferase (CCA-adding enzyme)
MSATFMDEAALQAKLERIEALFAGAATAGERSAAAGARERILARLHALARESPAIEYRFSMADLWSRKLFLALLRRYELTPYRYRGQRHTTVMVRVPKRFVDETLWPEFEQLSNTLRRYLDEVTARVVAQVLDGDGSEAVEVDGPPALEFGGRER